MDPVYRAMDDHMKLILTVVELPDRLLVMEVQADHYLSSMLAMAFYRYSME